VVCGCAVLVFGVVGPCLCVEHDVLIGHFGLRGGTVSLKFLLGWRGVS
jgi:hypothetical protein